MTLFDILLLTYPALLTALFILNPRWAVLFFFSTKSSIDLLWNLHVVERLSVLKITGVIFPLLCLIYFIIKRPKYQSWPTLWLIYFWVIFVLNLLATIWGFSNYFFQFYEIPHSPLSIWHALDWNFRFFNLAGAFLIIPLIFRMTEEIQILLRAFLLSAVIPCILGIYQVSSISLPYMLDKISEPYSVNWFDRIKTAYHDPGTLSAVMFIAILSSTFLFFRKDFFLLKIGYVVMALSASLVLYFTFSRTWWISTAICIFLFFLLQKRYRLSLFVLVIAAVVFLAMPLTQKRFEREISVIINPALVSNTKEIEKLGTGRIWLWHDAFKHYLNLDTVSQLIGSGRSFGSHNQFIAWILRNGIIGLTVWCFFLYSLSKALYRKRKTVNAQVKPFIALALSLFITLNLVTNLFMQTFDNITLVYFSWSLFALSLLTQADESEKRSLATVKSTDAEGSDSRSDQIKVLIVQSRLAPFRVPFFEHLGRNVNLTVFYGSHSANGRSASKPVSESGTEYNEFRTMLLFRRLEMNWAMPYRFCLKKPDVVVFDGKTGFLTAYFILFLCKLRRIPVVLWTSGFEGPNPSMVIKIKKFIETAYYKAIDSFLVYSSHGSAYLVGRSVNEKKIHVAHNSVDTFVIDQLHRDVFTPEYRRHFRETLSTRESEEVFILYVGRLTSSKRIPLLFEAVKELEKQTCQVRLLVAGDGEEKEQLINEARKLGLSNYQFLGEISDPCKVNTLFFSSDIFVMPGLGGLALQQAMANGLPCIVSQADGTEKDLMSEKNGFIFPKNDVTVLTDRLRQLVNDKALRVSMGKTSRDIITKGKDMKSMIASFVRCLQQTLKIRTHS